MPRFAANLTMLFTEVPMLDRPGLALQAGFDGVEVLFPYDHSGADWVAGYRIVEGLPPTLFFKVPEFICEVHFIVRWVYRLWSDGRG